MDEFMQQQRFKVAHFWKGQVELYESRISQMLHKIHQLSEGSQAAKRRHDYDTSEIKRLQDLVLKKTE